MKAKVLIVLIVISLPIIDAQSFKDDMQKLRTAYENNYISMNVNYRMYDSEKDAQPAETRTMWMEAYGNKLHYKNQGEEIIYTDKNVLMVSSNDKEITLDTVTPNFNQPGNHLLPLDTVSSHMKSISFQDLGNGQVKYILIPKESDELSKIIYTINTKTWLLEKIELYSGSEMGGGKVTITYTQVSKQSEAPANSFSFKPFIEVKAGGGYTLGAAYSSYKFYHRNNYKK